MSTLAQGDHKDLSEVSDNYEVDRELATFVGIRRKGIGRLGAALMLLAVCLGLATFLILTGLTPIAPERNVVVWLLGLNAVLITLMALLIGWQVLRLFIARRKKVPGAVLHMRIVGLFSIFAAVPAIIVASFATVTLNRGLDTWFSEQTRSIVDSSVIVAKSYIEEQRDLVRADVSGLANNISANKNVFDNEPKAFSRQLATIVALRNLTAVYIIDRKKKQLVARITANSSVQFRPPWQIHLERASKGELVVIGPGNGNVIRGLKKLDNFKDHYLYVYRLINPVIMEQLAKANEQKKAYDQMRDQRTGLQVTFAMMYTGVAFVFLLAAAWFGFWFADKLVEPIVGLVRGARQVSKGKLDTKVKVTAGGDDLETLGQTFNNMTSQLSMQRNELVSANHQLDERRRFTEAVMSGVSAGVMGLDPDGRITLVNRSALRLLNRNRIELLDKKLADVLPEMARIHNEAEARKNGQAEGQVSLRVKQDDRSFVVQVTSEKTSEEEHGSVVTFDDISDLVAAQRNSAWADIARRIAHEIKNPLTPIQLAAERLKRKYGKEIKTTPEVFDKCTETIIRQVGDIRSMVDEFSSFARMPSAILERQDIVDEIRNALVLQKASFEELKIETDIPDGPIMLEFDRRLITQAMTNLVKNAKEAIDTRLERQPEPGGCIIVRLKSDDNYVSISVSDNGIGLPSENRGKLTEPYMTTRAKGTGLGLAIVKRIMQDHGGDIILEDADSDFDGGMGARVTLRFPKEQQTVKTKADQE